MVDMKYDYCPCCDGAVCRNCGTSLEEFERSSHIEWDGRCHDCWLAERRKEQEKEQAEEDDD